MIGATEVAALTQAKNIMLHHVFGQAKPFFTGSLNQTV